jgi:Tol biopolymer transport system component
MNRILILSVGITFCAFCGAFGQFPETSYDIYGLDRKTGDIFQITLDQTTGEFNPSWSCNGHFIVHDVLPVEGTQWLGITEVTTGVTTMLVGGEGGNNASWSPNGQWIAFDLCPGFEHGCDPRIFVVPAEGGVPRLIVSDAISPQWSNNSCRIVFARPSDGSIRTVDLSGTDERLVIAPAPGEWTMNSPNWSPNNQWIVFEWYGYILNLPVNRFGEPTGDWQIVANDLYYNYSPDWSNHSKMVVFGADNVLWTVSISGTDRTQITFPAVWGDYDPSYSNNGKYIAFSGYSPRGAAKLATVGETVTPSGFVLSQNYPNPFNPVTTISYQIPADASVTLTVSDIVGRIVARLVDGPQEAGFKSVTFDGSKLASGLYFYRLEAHSMIGGEAGNFVETRKLMLVK